MKSYLYAVQDENGREVVSVTLAPKKLSEVTAVLDADGYARILHGDEIVASGATTVEKEGNESGLRLHRWPANDKLSDPVTKVVPRA